ncbi:MAG: DUF3800 domain-containing protein [Pseudoflavonifractor sp.]|nr:DUF3800 domain-containing protein [Pseudoflavonifractor sp.]
MAAKERYNLYIDECGDHSLATYDRGFPIFTLCGILVPVSNANRFSKAVDELKREFWNTTEVILHSRDIRKCEKHFKILFDDEIKQMFYKRVNEVLSQRGVYVIVCCSVLKEDCIARHGIGADVYGTALKYVIQRSIFCVDDINPEGGTIDVTVERRGKREDAALLSYYNSLRYTGMHYITPERLTEHMGHFGFSKKSDNLFGLQVADLIAYPISRHVLSPDKSNPAFDVIAANIYQSNGKLLGLKIYPDKLN